MRNSSVLDAATFGAVSGSTSSLRVRYFYFVDARVRLGERSGIQGRRHPDLALCLLFRLFAATGESSLLSYSG